MERIYPVTFGLHCVRKPAFRVIKTNHSLIVKAATQIFEVGVLIKLLNPQATGSFDALHSNERTSKTLQKAIPAHLTFFAYSAKNRAPTRAEEWSL